MSNDTTLFRATKVPFRDFQVAQNIIAHAEAQAQDLLDRAHKDADGIINRAEARHAELSADLNTAWEDFDRTRQESEQRLSKARTMADLMVGASAVRAEFDALTPWISTLVETCIERVIGRMDDRTLMARIIAQGIAELQADSALTLRVGGQDHAEILALREEHPAPFAAITAIIPDSSVAPGTVQIEGAGGLITLGREPARSAIIASLREALTQDAATREHGDAAP